MILPFFYVYTIPRYKHKKLNEGNIMQVSNINNLKNEFIIEDLLSLLIKAQRLLDKCEDELGGFITPARAIRRDINEAIRKYDLKEEENE